MVGHVSLGTSRKCQQLHIRQKGQRQGRIREEDILSNNFWKLTFKMGNSVFAHKSDKYLVSSSYEWDLGMKTSSSSVFVFVPGTWESLSEERSGILGETLRCS